MSRVASPLKQIQSDQFESRADGLVELQALTEDSLAESDRVEMIAGLKQFMENPDFGDPERQTAAITLGMFGCERELCEYLNHDSPVLRGQAAAGLGKCRTPSSVLILIETLTDPVNTVRNLAERSLIGLQSEVNQHGIDRLLELLDHPEPLTHSPAARLLGLSQDPRALDPLVSMATAGEKWLTRMWAVKALGDLGQPAGFETLATIVQHDEKNRVRAGAAAALAELRHPDSKELLVGCKESEQDDGVLVAIGDALDALEKSGFAETSDPFAE